MLRKKDTAGMRVNQLLSLSDRESNCHDVKVIVMIYLSFGLHSRKAMVTTTRFVKNSFYLHVAAVAAPDS